MSSRRSATRREIGRPLRVCVICSGNICRSPIGEIVLRRRLTDAGLDGAVVVDSAGTGGWHVGDGADHRAVRALASAGYDGEAHRARRYDPAGLADHDLLLAADRGHLRQLRRWADDAGLRVAPADKGGEIDIRLLREFDPAAVAAGDLELADPYYGDDEDFRLVLAQVEAAAPGLVAHLRGLVEG